MSRLTSRLPQRPAEWTTTRKDGQPVSVWSNHKTQRSRDRVLDGTQRYGTVVAVSGEVVMTYPAVHPTPEAAIAYVQRMFE